jgi:hypothetical protein
MVTHRSYIWCHQEPTRSAGTRQGIHDVTSQLMCYGKWSALWTFYVILKRVPAHGRQSVSRYLFTFGPRLIGTFLLKWGWGIPRKSLWRRFWYTLYIPRNFKLKTTIFCTRTVATCFLSLSEKERNLFMLVMESWCVYCKVGTEIFKLGSHKCYMRTSVDRCHVCAAFNTIIKPWSQR